MTSNSRWLRGNLHAHTTLSDGAHSPEELIAAYQRRGYDFLALTDHDLVAPIDSYQESTPLLLISGTEVTAQGPHLCATGVAGDVAPCPDRQDSIDLARAQNALIVLNHPNWQSHFTHWPQEELERVSGYDGIEIFNGIVLFAEGNPVAAGRWDRLLSGGRRVWGFANDDTHFEQGIACGWNMVRLPADAPVTWSALRAALLAGDFYASTGVVLNDVIRDGRTLRVVSENADRIRFFGAHGRMLASVDGSEAAFTLPEGELYVRAEAYGPRGTIAWTQPIFAD